MRTKFDFAALAPLAAIDVSPVRETPMRWGIFQKLFGIAVVWAFQRQTADEVTIFLTNALCQKIKNHTNA